MKISLKKLGSAFMAMAMIATLSPVPGSAVLADETETSAPAAVESEETEAPKQTDKPAPEETKETEETTAETTAETSKETEAPKETEKPADETPKETGKPVTNKEEEPDQSSSRKAKNGPAQCEKKIDAYISSEGKLIWKDMLPEVNENVENVEESWISFYVYVSGVRVHVEIPVKNDASKQYSVALPSLIDTCIKSGEIKKAENNIYPVWIIADQDYSWIFASWSGEIYYESQAKQTKKLGSISAGIDANGNLKWKTYKNLEDYTIYINEYHLDIYSNKRTIPLKKEIDFMIKAGYLKKADTYNIRIVGYDVIDPAAKWEGTFTYASEAVPGGVVGNLENFELKNGVLTWNAYPGANAYQLDIYDGTKKLDYTYVRSNTADVNNYISEYIYESDMDLSKIRFTFKVTAVEVSSGDAPSFFEAEQIPIAVGSYDNYLLEKAPNPLSVTGKKATVKKKKLRRKKQTVSASKVFTGLNTTRGGFIFKKLSGNKNIKISKTTGTVTIKKNGLKKKKTYKVKVSVQSKGNIGYYASTPKVVTIKIKLK